MQRRTFIATVSSAAAVGLAGCGGSGTETDAPETDGDSSGGTDSGMSGTDSGMSGTDSGMSETDSGMSETDSGMSTSTESGMSGGSDYNLESPESPTAVVEAWYGLGSTGMSQEEIIEAQNTLLHTESILYPMEVQTASGGGGSGTQADMDIQFDGIEVGGTTEVESIQQDAPALMGLPEDVRTTLVEEGELTKVTVTPQYSGSDAPPEQEVSHYVAKEDGNWRLVQ